MRGGEVDFVGFFFGSIGIVLLGLCGGGGGFLGIGVGVCVIVDYPRSDWVGSFFR